MFQKSILFTLLLFLSSLASPLDCNTYLEEGEKLYAEGYFLAAKKSGFLPALGCDTTDTKALRALAEIEFRLGLYENSMQYCRKLLHISKAVEERYHAHMQIGRIFEELYLYDSAFAYYKRGDTFQSTELYTSRIAELQSKKDSLLADSTSSSDITMIHRTVPDTLVGLFREFSSLKADIEAIFSRAPAVEVLAKRYYTKFSCREHSCDGTYTFFWYDLKEQKGIVYYEGGVIISQSYTRTELPQRFFEDLKSNLKQQSKAHLIKNIYTFEYIGREE